MCYIVGKCEGCGPRWSRKDRAVLGTVGGGGDPFSRIDFNGAEGRRGDAAETECMMADIRMAAECGADGVVIGALRCDGSVDEDVCRAMVDAAKGMSITFHRAFDLCREQAEALERVIALGCHRLLTSGGAASAFEGSQRIAELNRQAAGRIVIMPGAGVTAANAAEILRLTGCHEIHASAREKADSVMAYRHHGVAMGAAGSDEFVRLETSQRAVAEILDAINRLP